MMSGPGVRVHLEIIDFHGVVKLGGTRSAGNRQRIASRCSRGTNASATSGSLRVSRTDRVTPRPFGGVDSPIGCLQQAV